MPDARGGKKWAVDAPRLEFQVVVSHHVCARKGAWVLCKSIKCSYLPLIYSPALYCPFVIVDGDMSNLQPLLS